jgi:hypothetical protein
MTIDNQSTKALAAALAQDPQAAEEAITRLTALQTDRWIYRIVVLALGFGVLTAIIGLIILSWKGIATVPDGIVAIGSAAVGALAGLLAPAPKVT